MCSECQILTCFDLDQARQTNWPDLDPNCLQRLSADECDSECQTVWLQNQDQTVCQALLL